MEKKDKKYWFSLCFFYFALILETLFVLLDKSNYIIQHETWLFRFTFLLFGVKILLTKYSKREWIAIGLMAVLSIVSWHYTDREEIARVCALMIACKDVDLHRTMKVVFWETFAGSLVIVALALTGIYGEIAITALYRGGGIEEIRYCLGMGHPNALHCMFWAIMLLFFYLYNDVCKIWLYLVAAAANFALYAITDSNTGVLIATITIAAFAFIRYCSAVQSKKIIYQLGVLGIAACIIFTIIAGLHGEEVPIIKTINRAINGRLQIALVQGGVAKWSFFSNESAVEYFDMGWMRLFYWYGMIPACVYIVAVCETIRQCYYHKDAKSFLVIMLFAVYTVVEAHAISVYIGRNYMFFMIGMYWTQFFTKKECC